MYYLCIIVKSEKKKKKMKLIKENEQLKVDQIHVNFRDENSIQVLKLLIYFTLVKLYYESIIKFKRSFTKYLKLL